MLVTALAFVAALVFPVAAKAGTLYVTVYNGSATHDVWKSKNMTSYGKFSRAKVTTGVTGCDNSGCAYSYMKVPGVGTFGGLSPSYASFKYTTGTFYCKWSYLVGTTVLRCYVGVPSS